MDRYDEDYQEIINMLTVIYERLDKLERKVKGGFKMTSSQNYLNELKREANKLQQLKYGDED
jgi:hypothetical protein